MAPDDATFVAIWSVGPNSADGVAVLGQLFLANGDPLDSQFTVVEADDISRIYDFAVEYIDDTHFVVAWTRLYLSFPGQIRPPSEIRAQRYEVGFLAPTCGDANTSGFYEATDALVILRKALNLAQCDACICDLDSSGTVAATDALIMLKTAVGQPTALECPPCESAEAAPH